MVKRTKQTGSIFVIFSILFILSGCSDLINDVDTVAVEGVAETFENPSEVIRFTGEDSVDSITEGFLLPTTTEEGATISWSCESDYLEIGTEIIEESREVLSNSEKMSRGWFRSFIRAIFTAPPAQTAVDLVATITKGTVTTVKTIALTLWPPVVTYTISGSISDLDVDGLVLQINGSNDLTISSGTTSFSFPTELEDDETYTVTVKTNPTGYYCSIQSGSGTVSGGNVTDINISCVENLSFNTIVKWAGGTGYESTADFTEGIGTAASLIRPWGLTTDGTYIYGTSDVEDHIFKIDPSTAAVTAFAGTADSGGYLDGTGTSAQFNSPKGITYHDDNLYILDSSNETIRKLLISTGEVTTFVGKKISFSGIRDGIGDEARLDSNSTSLTTDGTYLYWVGNGVVRKANIATAEVTTIFNDIDTIGWCFGIAYDEGFLYASSYTKHAIYKIDSDSGTVSVFSGTPGTSDPNRYSKDYDADQLFCNPGGLYNGEDGYLYLGEANRIRKVSLFDGTISTLFIGSDGPTLNNQNSVLVFNDNLYSASNGADWIIKASE